MSFTPLSRTGWLASASDVSFGAAANAIDGNTGTIWATGGAFPAWLVLDMNPATVLSRTGWSVGVDSTAGGYPASNLLDSNASSLWSSSGGSTGYITLDFGASQTFNILQLQTRPSSAQGSPNAFDVYVSSDGTTWGTAIASFTGSNNTTNAITSYPLPASQTTRYLKIAINSVWAGPSNIVLAEVFVANQTGTNPTFNALTYLPRQDGWNDFPGSIEIYVSNDGSTWGTPVATASSLPNSPGLQGWAFASQTARFLKFNILSAAAGARVYQGAAEVNVGTYTGTTSARLTAEALDTAITDAPPSARLTMAARDAIITDAPPSVRLTWEARDAVITGIATPKARLTLLSAEKALVPGTFVVTQNLVTQLAIEAVIKLPAPTYRGHIQYDQIRATARKGAGSMFQMFGSGPTQPGDLAMYAGDGSLIDAGFPLFVLPIRTTAVNTTMSNADYSVVATAPSITVTLPPAPLVGQLANVKNGNVTTGQLITVSAGTAAIDVSSTVSLGATASLHVQWDGTMWRIL